MRDIATSPQPGDTFHHPRFGGGCTFRVVKTMQRKGWGPAVQLHLTLDDGRTIKPSWRVYSLEAWADFVTRGRELEAAALTHQEPAR